MNNYLLELGVEEFPSRFIHSTKQQLLDHVQKGIEEGGLTAGQVRIESTPRRFSLWLSDLQAKAGDEEEIVRGPSKAAAYDAEGQPTKALQGFLKSKGLSPEEVYVENNGKADYVFAKVKKEAVSIEKVLAQVVPAAIRQVSNPRSMRWGGKNLLFLRPIRWIVSLYNDQVLPFDLEGIPVSNRTRGHRFLASQDLEVSSIEGYEALLEDNYVIVDEKKREDIIRRGLNRLSREKGGSPLMDSQLLDEVIHIVEYPTVFLGKIPEDYLSLPPEVIITPMKDHQRYFPVLDSEGELLPYFLGVRDGGEQGLDNVVAGNEKVLVPRLEDAKFFYRQDLSRSLEEYVPQLDGLVFHEKLGTMLDKTQRLEKLVLSINKAMRLGQDNADHAVRAAFLSKADLVTQMVVEFTELQGTMGRIYALEAGESEIVARAIEEQYMPVLSGGALPESSAGMTLALADKIDTIAGLFAIGVEVTGSQDPFGLRRQALGVIDIILHSKLHIDLRAAFRDALLLYVEGQNLVFDYDEVIGRIDDFFRGRLKTKFREENIRYDVVDAVLATDSLDLLSLKRKMEAVQALLDQEGGQNLVTSFVRVQSLSREEAGLTIEADQLLDEDQPVYVSLDRKGAIEEACSQDHYEEALDILKAWMPQVNDYLDHTLINTEDEGLRRNRLAMINTIYQAIALVFLPQYIVRD